MKISVRDLLWEKLKTGWVPAIPDLFELEKQHKRYFSWNYAQKVAREFQRANKQSP